MVDIRMPDGHVVPIPDDVTEEQIREFLMGGIPRAVGMSPWSTSSPNRHADIGATDAATDGAVPAGTSPFAGFADRLQAFGEALEAAMPPSAPRGGSFPGNRRENGNALANVLTSPTVTDMLIKRRLNFLG